MTHPVIERLEKIRECPLQNLARPEYAIPCEDLDAAIADVTATLAEPVTVWIGRQQGDGDYTVLFTTETGARDWVAQRPGFRDCWQQKVAGPCSIPLPEVKP